MDKKKLIRIIVPICIVLIVAGIYMFKNSNEEIGVQENSIDKNAPTNSATLIEDENFELEATSIDLDLLTSYGLPVIIDFGSDSCAPCQEMAPALESMNVKMQGKAIIKFVDVWENVDAANGFPIQVIPTQLFIDMEGKAYVPSDNIQIEFTLYRLKDTEEHVYTVHQGGLTEEQMKTILIDMGVVE